MQKWVTVSATYRGNTGIGVGVRAEVGVASIADVRVDIAVNVNMGIDTVIGELHSLAVVGHHVNVFAVDVAGTVALGLDVIRLSSGSSMFGQSLASKGSGTTALGNQERRPDNISIRRSTRPATTSMTSSATLSTTHLARETAWLRAWVVSCVLRFGSWRLRHTTSQNEHIR